MLKFSRALGAALPASTSTAALAQSSTVPEPESSENEIVVTAQKREQKIEDVPVTVIADMALEPDLIAARVRTHLM